MLFKYPYGKCALINWFYKSVKYIKVGIVYTNGNSSDKLILSGT